MMKVVLQGIPAYLVAAIEGSSQAEFLDRFEHKGDSLVLEGSSTVVIFLLGLMAQAQDARLRREQTMREELAPDEEGCTNF